MVLCDMTQGRKKYALAIRVEDKISDYNVKQTSRPPQYVSHKGRTPLLALTVLNDKQGDGCENTYGLSVNTQARIHVNRQGMAQNRKACGCFHSEPRPYGLLSKIMETRVSSIMTML